MAFVDREGGCVEEPLPVPGQDPWGSWEHRLPQLTTPHQAWGPSLPALLPGLPDEAFESLTQLQHIYVAYNKVSAPPTPYWAPGLAHLGSHSTDCRGQHGAGRGPPGPVNCVPQLSVAPQFLPRSLRVVDLAANQVTEIFPLTFGEKPALR